MDIIDYHFVGAPAEMENYAESNNNEGRLSIPKEGSLPGAKGHTGGMRINEIATTSRRSATSKESNDSISKQFVSVKQTNYSTQFDKNLRYLAHGHTSSPTSQHVKKRMIARNKHSNLRWGPSTQLYSPTSSPPQSYSHLPLPLQSRSSTMLNFVKGSSYNVTTALR